MSAPSRKHIDIDCYIESTQTETCFLCEIASHNPEYPHHIVYEDEGAINFLNKYPMLYGYS